MPRPDEAAGSPVANANTTPLTVIGVADAERLCETHPGSIESAPPVSASFRAITAPSWTAPLVAGAPVASAPAIGNRIQVVPPPEAGCWRHVASASALTV